MRIIQNAESGQVNIQLGQNEKYDIEEHLHALTEFLHEQAIENHELRNSYKEL